VRAFAGLTRARLAAAVVATGVLTSAGQGHAAATLNLTHSAGECSGEITMATADRTGTVTFDYTVMSGPFGANSIVCGPTQPCATEGSSHGAVEDIGFS
jgi:hypothetical protein